MWYQCGQLFATLVERKIPGFVRVWYGHETLAQSYHHILTIYTRNLDLRQFKMKIGMLNATLQTLSCPSGLSLMYWPIQMWPIVVLGANLVPGWSAFQCQRKCSLLPLHAWCTEAHSIWHHWVRSAVYNVVWGWQIYVSSVCCDH